MCVLDGVLPSPTRNLGCGRLFPFGVRLRRRRQSALGSERATFCNGVVVVGRGFARAVGVKALIYNIRSESRTMAGLCSRQAAGGKGMQNARKRSIDREIERKKREEGSVLGLWGCC